ncbi:hypothetical protein NNC19_12660 [Clostridium sp. SHJSY1]|uniref:O-antigen ligase family protein n=1 Tax=Clostridium sp. SHJSY1 TaxID=2942483 RepID=UPI0028754D0F|nr:O-antigen ligase family protein [Clostridium sp. SHJSY1]MDS0526535.1 hypothetical protein [Clostridium sp. SHJSY1]
MRDSALKSNKRNSVNYLASCLTIPYIVISLLYIKTDNFRYICFFLMILFIVGFFILKKKVHLRMKYAILILFLILVTISFLSTSGLVESIKNTVMIILSFAPIFIFDFFYLENSNDRKYAKIFLCFIIPVLLYTVFATLYYLYSDPQVAREMVTWNPSSEVIDSTLPIAIGGGYALIYGVMLIPVVLFYIIRRIQCKAKMKLLYFILMLFFLYFIFRSGFTTAFLISLFGIYIVFLSNIQHNKVLKMIIISVVTIIAGYLCIYFGVLDYIGGLLPSDSIISIRLNEIRPALFNGNKISSFGLRLELLQKSFSAFINNPLFGVGYKVGQSYANEGTLLGLHSEWVDNLGRYGIVMGLPYFSFIFLCFRDLIKKYKNTKYKDLIVILVCLIILLGFCNPIKTSSAFLFLFVVVPSYLNIEFHNSINNKKIIRGDG